MALDLALVNIKDPPYQNKNAQTHPHLDVGSPVQSLSQLLNEGLLARSSLVF
jgi:hypothetical protein